MILDTVHVLPGELLDFLVVLPHITNNAIIVLHDYHLFFDSFQKRDYFSNKILYDSCVAEKFIIEDNHSKFLLPNIAALKVNEDTFKYRINLFSILTMKWAYLITETEYNIYLKYYEANFGSEYSKFLKLAYSANKDYFSHDPNIKFKYITYRILSKITFGKLGKKYMKEKLYYRILLKGR